MNLFVDSEERMQEILHIENKAYDDWKAYKDSLDEGKNMTIGPKNPFAPYTRESVAWWEGTTRFLRGG